MAATKNKTARTVIELLCKILETNGICAVRAETFRQSKFDKSAAANEMGQVLFSVVCFCDQHSNEGIPHTSKIKSDEQKMVYVKTKLQSWGYLSQSFSSLPNNLSSGSHELLLAVGWVIYTQAFVDKIISKCLNPLQQSLSDFVKDQRPPSKEALLGFTNNTQSLPLQEKIQYHMMLIGKLRLSLRRLHSTYKHLTNLTKTIHHSTEGVSLQRRLKCLTPLEVHAVKSPSIMKKLLHEFEEDNKKLNHLLEWKQKESLFWEWMVSVINAPEENEEEAKAGVEADLNVYLPVPLNIGQQLETARAKLRDVILDHEAQMTNLEKILGSKKVSEVEVEVFKMQMDKELHLKAMELHECAFGERRDLSDPSSSQDKSVESRSTSAMFKNQNWNVPHRGYTTSKPQYMSPFAIKTAEQAALLKEVSEEISLLEVKVKELETDLHRKQMENMHKVQDVIELNQSVICIQPRSIKQSSSD